MIPYLREKYNRQFSEQQYNALIDQIERDYNHRPLFKVAETPVFVPDDLKTKLFAACDEISQVICSPDFKDRSEGATLSGQVVPNETKHTTFLQMDFGICKDADGNLIPQLIEIQGFPSLYFYQYIIGQLYRKYFDIPDDYSHLFQNHDSASYLQLLRKTIVGSSKPENVVLVEIEPHKQTTQIDFWVAQKLLGISVKCVSEIKRAGRSLYYVNEKGAKIPIEKIFNRVIFDELIHRDDLVREFYFTEEADVKWIGHPNWFFRISKHTLPLFRNSKYVPDSYYLHKVDTIPEDLDNYVLKPLYSFSGTGVIINLHKFDLEGISNPENYILQRKVQYESLVPTFDEPAKCEIRMLMLWEEDAPRPVIVNNLARLSKGIMVGVRYNKDKTWVGGSVGYFSK